MLDRPASVPEIEAAYRLILGREPDASGLANFQRHAERGMTLAQMRQEFIGSPEFRHVTGMRLPDRVSVGDIIVDIDANEPDFGRHIARTGGWEPHVVAEMVANLQAGDVFVDIGANVGIMSFSAAATIGPTGQVLAFEPHADNIQHFVKGVVANKLDNVLLYPFALSDRRALFSLVGTSNGYLMPAGTAARQALALRGDDILLDEPRIDFIKMDIEGHEPFALDGLAATIARHRPKILCEFNPRCLVEHIGRDPAEFAAQLFGLTDRIDSIEYDGPLQTVRSAGELMDFWRRKNRKVVDAGLLPDGMVHLDLLF